MVDISPYSGRILEGRASGLLKKQVEGSTYANPNILLGRLNKYLKVG